MKKLQQNSYDDSRQHNKSIPEICNTSSSSVEKEENKELVTFEDPSTRDFTTPEKGLARYVSRDSWKILSSEEVTLKVPETYFLHHFIYNCKDQAFCSSNNIRESKKIENKILKNIYSFACPASCNFNAGSQNSKSQTEVVLNIPRECYADSMIDIRLMGTISALQNNILDDDEEYECVNLLFDTDNAEQVSKNMETKYNSSVSREKADSTNKYIENYEFIASSKGNIKSSCEEAPGENKHSAIADKNKVSIKLGENLYLSLIADVEELQKKSNIQQLSLDEKEDEKLPSIKILLKSNGEIIRELPSHRIVSTENRDNIVSDINEYEQIFCVNTLNKRTADVESDKCTDTSCRNKNKMEDIPLEFSQICPLKVGTTSSIKNMLSDGQAKSNCSLRGQAEVFDSLCTECCNLLSRIEKSQDLVDSMKKPTKKIKKSTQPPEKAPPRSQKNIIRKQTLNRKHDKEQSLKSNQVQDKPGVESKNKTIIDQFNNNRNITASPFKDSMFMKSIASTTEQMSSTCLCPSEKDNIASLGSFSLFFIINDMKTGDCRCTKTESNELLQTAMICIHVDDSQGKQIKNQNATTSCPVICSCPSTNISRSSCSCPSMRFAPNLPIVSSLSVKPQSFMPKTSCTQRSQIRFSLLLQTKNDKSCSVIVSPEQKSTCTQCRSNYVVKSKQTSVQVIPSHKSAAIQPSVICTPRPQSVQTSISLKSASVQPSICFTRPSSQFTATQKSQVLREVYPPSCKINLHKLVTGAYDKKPGKVIMIPSHNITAVQPTARILKAGASVTNNTSNTCSCSSLKQAYICSENNFTPASRNSSNIRVKGSTETQSKNCTTVCVDLAKSNDSTNLKNACSFNGQEATSMDIKKGNRKQTARVKSKTSCNICDEMAKLGACVEDLNNTAYLKKARVIPASAKLKRARDFEKLSHLNVSGADNFIFSENMKGDLDLITEDYSDLKQAFEKFMMSDSEKNRKCKYIKKG